MGLDPAATPATPAPDRACGTCTLCCKVYDIPAVESPAGQWCRHCQPGKGCSVHPTRPDQCRDFTCLWMLAPFLGPEWKPDRARFVLTVDPASHFLLVQSDPASPAAWRKAPYHAQLRQWAAAGIENGRQVIVINNRAATVILPDRDVSLGLIGPDEEIVLSSAPLPGGGKAYDAVKRRAAPRTA